MSKKGFAPILVLIVVGVLAVAGGTYYFVKTSGPASQPESPAVKPPEVGTPLKDVKAPSSDPCSDLTELGCSKDARCVPIYEKKGFSSDDLGNPLFNPVFVRCESKTIAQPVDCSIDANSGAEQCKQIRDAKRITDLKLLRLKLELYYNKFGHYPQSSNWADLAKILTDAEPTWSAPNDPLTPQQEYMYGSDANGSNYVLGASLEATDNKAFSFSEAAKGMIFNVNCSGQIYCLQP